MHPHIAHLLSCVQLEEKAQTERYRLDEAHSLRQLKAEGLALHPISIRQKTFGYADYPEVSFSIPYPAEVQQFKDGAAIELFFQGEESIKAMLLNFDGRSGSIRLYAPDFPDWLEDRGVGIKLAPDTRSSQIMKTVLGGIENNAALLAAFEQLHQNNSSNTQSELSDIGAIDFVNKNLIASQQQAVQAVVHNPLLCIIHGPPGTGKTTTLVEAVLQLISRGKRVLITAPANAAVDHFCKALLKYSINLFRVGNTGKVDEAIYNCTAEGRLKNSTAQKEIKQLKIRAEEFRRMALKYKRQFGKAEREQRNLLLKEVKEIRGQIKKLQQYHEEKLWSTAQVVAGTPIGIYDACSTSKQHFDCLLIDEAGQCLEPLAWCAFSFADKWVLAGDPYQLPPTVLSMEAQARGFHHSILEQAIKHAPHLHLLNIQYRMNGPIAGFSNRYFYNNQLLPGPGLQNKEAQLLFIDTAGSGFEETTGPDGCSLQNDGELKILKKIIDAGNYPLQQSAFISPYAGQVALAREWLPMELRCSTIDSFQGQECHHVFISLVRSNADGIIGFLKDYRRMNVALTRAKDSLVIIGDSACLGADPFYQSFFEYAGEQGTYQSVWEYEWD